MRTAIVARRRGYSTPSMLWRFRLCVGVGVPPFVDPFKPLLTDALDMEMSPLSEPCDCARSCIEPLPPWSLPVVDIPLPFPEPFPFGELDRFREKLSCSVGRPDGGCAVVGETSGDELLRREVILPRRMMGLPPPLSLPLLFFRMPEGR